MNFEHCREFQARNTQLIDIIFAMKKNLLSFLELPPAFSETRQANKLQKRNAYLDCQI